MDTRKLDQELTKKIEKVVFNGADIKKSREKQRAAERLIQTQKDFRRRNGIDKVY